MLAHLVVLSPVVCVGSGSRLLPGWELCGEMIRELGEPEQGSCHLAWEPNRVLFGCWQPLQHSHRDGALLLLLPLLLTLTLLLLAQWEMEVNARPQLLQGRAAADPGTETGTAGAGEN